MSVQAISWVLENSKSRLGARLVLLSLANHADRDGKACWPAISTIAREAGMTPRNVQFVLKKLEESGEIVIDRNAGPHGTHKFEIVLVAGDEKFQTEKFSGVKKSAENVSDFSPEPSFNRPKEKKPSVSKRKRQIPKDCPAKQDQEKAVRYWREKGVDIDLETQIELFRSHHESRATLMVDWSAAWRTWYVRATSFSSAGKKAQKPEKPFNPDDQWRGRMKIWSEHDGWMPEWGPPPGEVGCRVPAEVIREFGGMT